MAKFNTIFKRYEYKYLLNRAQRRYVEDHLAGRMRPDQYGETTICNVYYDTPDYRLIRKSIEKPVYKEKLRLRSYGRATEDGTVFLELKKKYDGIVYKRRISLKESEAEQYLSGEAPLPKSGQIEREIDYFRWYYGTLQPAMYLCYDRIAWYSADDPNLRITFDRNIRFRQGDHSLESLPGGRQLLDVGQSLMEIKVAGAMPLWLVDILNEANIRKTPFSKYGKAYSILLEEMLYPHTVGARHALSA